MHLPRASNPLKKVTSEPRKAIVAFDTMHSNPIVHCAHLDNYECSYGEKLNQVNRDFKYLDRDHDKTIQ